MIESLNEIFSRIFGRPIQVSDSLIIETIKDWDSLNQVLLFDAVEKKFNISLFVSEIMAVETVGDLIRLIESKTRKAA